MLAASAAKTHPQAKMASLPEACIPVANSHQSVVTGPEQTISPHLSSDLHPKSQRKAGEA
jgi:hypothetical protein